MSLQPPCGQLGCDEHSAMRQQPLDLGPPFPRRWVPVRSACRPVPVPEGRRRRLAGGKSAPADAAPGNGAEWLRAPAGHRRNGPGRWPTAGGLSGQRRRVVAEPLRGGRRQKLLRCPAGAWPVRRGHRGPRPLARACPRLISCGVPPGPKARRRRLFSGGLRVASATAKPSRRARIFPLHGRPTPARRHAPRQFVPPIPLPQILLPNSTVLTNGCVPRRRRDQACPSAPATLRALRTLRGAAGCQPATQQPASLRYFGCGSAALCSSRLWGPIRSPRRADTA